MKALSLSLFVFASVVLLSCAFPQDAGNDGPRSLVESRARERYLQRRKPPPNIPGPKLSPKELNTGSLADTYEYEQKAKKRASYITEKDRKRYARLMKSNRSGHAASPRRAKNYDDNLTNGDKQSLGGDEQENERRRADSRDDLLY